MTHDNNLYANVYELYKVIIHYPWRILKLWNLLRTHTIHVCRVDKVLCKFQFRSVILSNNAFVTVLIPCLFLLVRFLCKIKLLLIRSKV